MTLSKRDEFRQSARTTTWKAVGIQKLDAAQLSDFMEYHRDVNPDFSGSLPEIWVVAVIERRGQLRQEWLEQPFPDEKRARDFVEMFKEERVIHANDPSEVTRKYTKEMLDTGLWRDYWVENLPNRKPASDKLAAAVLIEAEIIAKDLKTNPEVLNFAGESRISELKSSFPTTWQFVAELEFAMLNLSKDSPAYIACAIRYCKYFSKDLLLAGYLIRDLEVLLSGAENKHRSAVIRKQKSTQGTRHGAEKRLLGRHQTLIQQLEEMVKNPEKYRLSPSAEIEKVATKAANLLVRQRNPNWSVGGVQSVPNYLANIRHDVEHQELRSRLENVEKSIKAIKNQYVIRRST
jgi:hypothetical protein